MKIALIQLPNGIEREADLELPTGILALASYLKTQHHSPFLIDLNYLLKKRILSYKDKFYKRTAEYIVKTGQRIFGFSVMCSNLPAALLIAEELKKLKPDSFIIFGGPDVSFEDVALLKAFKQVEVVVRGEGEITLTELLGALRPSGNLADISGITFRKGHQIIRNPDRELIKDLDDLPYPNFKLLPHSKDYKLGAMEGGRGCPFSCTFCATCKMWKRKFRIKSPARLADELAYVYQHFKKTCDPAVGIRIRHDNLLANRKKALKFLRLIAGKGLIWTGSVRLDDLDDEIMKAIKGSDCRGLFVGVETASPRMQKAIKKKIDLKRLPQVIGRIAQSNINLTLSFIIGFPDEKEADINATLLCLLRSKLSDYNLRFNLLLYTILKGSELYSSLRGLIKAGKITNAWVSPFLARLPGQRVLVKEHPDVFPSFYYPKINDFDIGILQKVAEVFSFVVDHFPITSLLLLKLNGLRPLPYALRIIRDLEERGIKWRFMSGPKEKFDCYLSCFKMFIEKQNLPDQVKEVLAREENISKRLFKSVE